MSRARPARSGSLPRDAPGRPRPAPSRPSRSPQIWDRAFRFPASRKGRGELTIDLYSSLEAGEIKEITVEIASGNVFLTCPEEKSEWWDKKSDLGTSRILNISAPDDLLEIERGKEFSCGQKKSKSWRIYLKIKGCKDCVELSLGLGAGIIVADLLLTLGVLLLVYFCSQKQPGLFRPGAPRRQRLQGQQADHPPPVPNPDYEPIRKGQGEVYAGLAPQAF
ncbi:T-cell surface glycoprotein CD3 epsilon chain isoform X2 [Thamnophis elegans]|uniref:T-cell surface glycoprotein CD3 epsilon chain isoform X2 n=1 Tax=Thamnophis elegans TaxID=35005 RepID=UPI0013764F28|nr:T-cell surface glycoprotein CD3 epsilon chain isoform X2 [Thamnophis elegans]